MHLVSFSPQLPNRYRADETLDELSRLDVERHLSAALDALNLAVLVTESAETDARDRLEQAAQARGFLVEAALALARARVYLSGVRTYSIPVIMTIAATGDAELARLHQMATRLLWWNHSYFPQRPRSRPLEPEDEAQLAVFFKGLARNAHINNALRYRWIAVSTTLAAALAILGLPMASVITASFGALLVGFYLVRKAMRQQSPASSR